MSKAEEVKVARLADLKGDSSLKFIQFRGQALMSTPSTHGFVPMRSDDFARLAYDRFLGISRSNIDDLMHEVRVTAPDRTDLAKYIAFRDKIWDMEKLDFTDETLLWVYSSDIAPKNDTSAAWTFLTQLAKGDEALARDYLQAMAPLAMARKPSGIIWFVGGGSNGKSALINALYKILGRYFASMTTSAIEDGRDTPRLNGVLGNICRESSESRVEDTERYKAIGTHEPFAIHKFHSQDMVEVDTNFHTIFNANNIPVFSDKTKGARRRTLIIPFPAHFQDDPTFEDRTFTPAFLGGMITLILEETKNIRDRGYKFDWSEQTLAAKASYDSEVNSAEAFVDHLKQSGIVGFYNYASLKTNYENWCSLHGMIPLGVTQLRRSITNETELVRKPTLAEDGKRVQRYYFKAVEDKELVWLNEGYGLLNEADVEAAKKLQKPTNRVLSKDW